MAGLVLIPLCRKGDRVGIERHLEAGTGSVDEVDIEGNTPLHVAVEAPRNETATVQCILEGGGNVNAVNCIGATPMHYVSLRKSNHRGVANILLEHGADINRQTLAGKTVLHFACENNLAEFTETLCLFGADPNVMDSEGNAPIHLALMRADGRDTVRKQILEHLIAYSANHSVANCEGLYPLHLAAKAGCFRCVQCLLDKGVDVQVLTARGETALHLACAENHAEVTQMILTVFPASLDMQDCEGNTALHRCALAGTLDSALLLLKASADTSVKNVNKKTAFDLAKMKGTDLSNTHNPELLQALNDAKGSGGCRQS